jgi:uncharacterized protein YidB (DUF937 family)
MGLLDNLEGVVKSALEGGDASGMPDAINGALAQTGLGDLNGVVAQLQQSGLGTQVSSWLGSGSNLPVTADQLQAALGDEHVQAIARHFGLPIDGAMQLLAQHLPAAVDQASPAGSVNPS